MIGEMEIIQQGMEKRALIPEEGPKWGTTPVTDIPGEAHPEGVDENTPVGDDAQNTRVLQDNFSGADKSEAESRNTLMNNFAHFNDPSRSSSSQLIKDYPRTPRSYQVMRETLQSRLGA